MEDFKVYFKNLIGFDLILIAAYLFICSMVGIIGDEINAYKAILDGLPTLFIILIATILVFIGGYILDEL